MNFLPLVVRELKAGSRKTRTYYGRVGIVLIAMVFGGGMASLGPITGAPSFLFTTFATFLFIYSLTAAARTADSLAREKREGTLGLLFLTDLKSMDIVLGKLAAGGLPILFGLLATFPVAGLALTVGGLELMEFLRVCLALVNVAFLALAIGIFFSSVNREYKPAISSSTTLLLILWWGLSLATQLLRRYYPKTAGFLELFNPHYAIDSARASIWGITSNHYWLSLLVIHALAWWFVYWTARILPRLWQDRPAARNRVAPALPTPASAQGSLSSLPPLPKKPVKVSKRVRNRALLDVHPMTFLMNRKNSESAHGWIGIGGLLFISVVTSVGYQWAAPGKPWFPIFLIVNFIVSAAALVLFKLFLCNESSRPLFEEQSQGTLEWLLCTPMNERQIVSGLWQGLRRVYQKPLVAYTVFILLAAGVMSVNNQSILFVLVAIMISAVAWMDFVAIVWAGMWFGLKARDARQGGSRTGWAVLVWPTILYIIAVMPMMAGMNIKMNLINGVFWYFLWSLVCDGAIIYWARRNLYGRMRSVAVQRFEVKEGWRALFAG